MRLDARVRPHSVTVAEVDESVAIPSRAMHLPLVLCAFPPASRLGGTELRRLKFCASALAGRPLAADLACRPAARSRSADQRRPARPTGSCLYRRFGGLFQPGSPGGPVPGKTTIVGKSLGLLQAALRNASQRRCASASRTHCAAVRL